ncbi:MAG: hypothetical protein ACKVP4_02240 [Hyphomicrobium sp.]
MATAAQYATQPTHDYSTGNTANANRDGTGTTVVAASGVGTAGKRKGAPAIQKEHRRIRPEQRGARRREKHDPSQRRAKQAQAYDQVEGHFVTERPIHPIYAGHGGDGSGRQRQCGRPRKSGLRHGDEIVRSGFKSSREHKTNDESDAR